MWQIMKFKIKDQLESYNNEFVIEIETMYGDADGEGIIIVGGFKKDDPEIVNVMQDVVETLERMKSENVDDYHSIEGFNKFFFNDHLSDEEYESMSMKEKSIAIEWERDPTRLDGEFASLEGYTINYYDKEGRKFRVEATY